MQVQLQEPKAGTCVSCATVNALRCFGQDADIDEVIEALNVPRFHGDGSYVHKAAKYLRQQHGMDVVISRPPYLVTDPAGAAMEVARRFDQLLKQGYVGLIHRKETAKTGHAVVLRQVLWSEGEPYFLTYDSNKRHTQGEFIYKVQDYVWWTPEDADPERDIPTPTGRIGYFVRPGHLDNVTPWEPKRSPFRSRPKRKADSTGAESPPGG